MGPEGASRVPAVPMACTGQQVQREAIMVRLGSFPFWLARRGCISKSNKKILLCYKEQFGQLWQEKASLEDCGNSHNQRDDSGPSSPSGSWSGCSRNQRPAFSGLHCRQGKSAPAVLSNFVTTAWDSHPKEERKCLVGPAWAVLPPLAREGLVHGRQYPPHPGLYLKAKVPREEEVDTARDQSRKVLGEDLNWQMAKEVLSSDKFLSRQRADWQPTMVES